MRRPIAILSAALLLTGLLAGGVQAASPHQVDPSTMVPPLNPAYDPWVCTVTGAGPICRGHAEDAWQDADTGLRCGTDPVYSTGDYASDGTRWHLSDGRATHTFFNNMSLEDWTLSPSGAGPIVTLKARWIEHFVYGEPGVLATRVRTVTGIDFKAMANGAGVVFQDTGWVRYLPGAGTPIDDVKGPHDSNHGDLDLVMPDVCAVLRG